MPLYEIAPNYVDKSLKTRKNKLKKWTYGYDAEHDLIIISKDGTIGEIYHINGLYIALPEAPDKVENNNSKWKPTPIPQELSRLKTIFDWNRKDNPFKLKYVDYIDEEFDRREKGHWFINKNKKTYVTGSHYMYLNWSKIDVGLPDFRESNRIYFIYWEACKADNRCFGMIYLKNRRSGFSFMSASETSNIGTISKDARLGICSKTGNDAKKMFTDKVVPIVKNYPFFFKPVQDGMDNPKTELAFRLPASRITKKNMYEESNVDEVEGLDTSIDWKNTDENAYDGEKLLFLVEDEAAKLERPNNILNGWRVRKTCLRLGSRITGKCMMGSTANALLKGGQNYKDLYYDSDPKKRNKNGQTKSGLYSLFIPMDYNFEGYLDEYGFAVIDDPKEPIKGLDGEWITQGVVSYWNNEVESLKSDPDALNEWYRQFPRTESHAFRDESKASIFNLTKIYQQVDYNESLIRDKVVVRGSFHWRDGKQDSEVIWTPDVRGRFAVSWMPPATMRNNIIKRNGVFYPGNEHVGAFGCDPYDISGTVDGRASNGALHGKTGFTVDDAPSNFFFLEYIARPQTAEIFFEEVLMACVFYGMPILIENNKQRLLYWFKNRGYRNFSINRPDKKLNMLSKTERELGGIPNSSEDVKQAHASGIETYIEKYVGIDTEGTYRDPEDVGQMYFSRTLEDWARFDINNRTKHDASISSGLAIMATNRHAFVSKAEKPKLTVRLPRYDNTGTTSKIVRN